MASLKEYQPDRIALEVYEACARRAMAEPHRGYLGMSSIGKPCERSLWLQCHGADRDPIDGQLARRFDCGHATETRVLADLRAAGYTITGEQGEFSDFDGRFRGHCDGIIHGLSKSHPERLLEIKSANDASFKNFQRHGLKSKPVYEAQMQCYMGYGGHERGLFVVENKNNQELYTERVCFDRAAFEALKAKAKRILDAPEPPKKTSDESECRYGCSYNLACANPPQVQAPEPPAPKTGCAGCFWFYPSDAAPDGTREVVTTLRALVGGARNLDPAKQDTERKTFFNYFNQALAYRPDLSFPMALYHRRAESLEKQFREFLEYVLAPANGWVERTSLFMGDDLLNCRFTGTAAAGDWCGHPGHKARVHTPMGCPDWAETEVPF